MSELSPGDSPAEATTSPLSATMFWGLALAAALAAGLAGWAIGELTHTAFIAPLTTVPGPNAPFTGQLYKDKAEAYTKNVLLTYSVTGAIFGLVLGLVGGLLRSSAKGAIGGGVLGVILGALTMASEKGLLLVYFQQTKAENPDPPVDFIVGFVIRGGLAAGLALVSSIAFGFGQGATTKKLFSIALNGMVGGVIGAVVYIVIGAFAFSQDHVDDLIPSYWIPRLLGFVVVALIGTGFAASAAGSS